ncbi:membrane protein insertase YidC [Streptomycetaceae bacterium NBC_01309]
MSADTTDHHRASGFLDGPLDLAGSLFGAIADLLAPMFGTGAVAAAVVMVTVCVRITLVPLSYAQARAQVARARIAPQMRELRSRHQRRRTQDPAALQRDVAALHRAEGVSPFAGCLPALAQAPVLFLLYHLVTSDDLLGHALAGIALSAHPVAALTGPHGIVPAILLVLALFVAYAHFRQAGAAARRAATAGEPTPPAAAVLRFLPYATVATVAVAPLAAGLYILTGSAWSAAERPLLRRLAEHRAPRNIHGGSLRS